jgi:hypothetical protein
VIPKPLTLLLALSLLLSAAPLEAADPAAAERQYRIARRLLAEGSAEARIALDKVIELDPVGDLADDATIDKALLLRVPRWPEELGRIEIRAAQEALGLVSWVASELSGSDRALEARYLRALLLLEPLPFHDASEARLDLITVATAKEQIDSARAARYATGWLAEKQGKQERALAAYQRLMVDAPGSEAAARARVGIARLLLHLGRFGEAADLLQQAIEAGVQPETGAVALRELAVRSLLGRMPGAGGGSVTRLSGAGSTVRSPACFAATPDGGLLLGDQKNDEVLLVDSEGGISGRWSLVELQAVAVSPSGPAFAAAGEAIYRLDHGRKPMLVANQGDLGPVSALAVDGVGRLWVLDRRGERLGRIEPGGTSPIVTGGGETGARLAALAWDGRRLIALDTRERLLVAVGPEGSRRELAAPGLQKPVDVAANPAGGIAVLDSRAGAVLLFDAEGSRLGSLAWSAAGISRATAVAYAPDGALYLLDGSNAVSVRVP